MFNLLFLSIEPEICGLLKRVELSVEINRDIARSTPIESEIELESDRDWLQASEIEIEIEVSWREEGGERANPFF